MPNAVFVTNFVVAEKTEKNCNYSHYQLFGAASCLFWTVMELHIGSTLFVLRNECLMLLIDIAIAIAVEPIVVLHKSKFFG